MANGQLVPKDGGTFHGTVATLKINLPIILAPNPNHRRENPDSPRFEVFHRQSVNGEQRMGPRIGAAWEKTARDSGEVFLSIMLDDPSFDQPLNVSAFPREGGGYDIVWRRLRQRAAGGEFRADPGRIDEEPPL